MQFNDYGVELSSARKHKIESMAAKIELRMSRHRYKLPVTKHGTYGDKKKQVKLTVLSSLSPHLAFSVSFKR